MKMKRFRYSSRKLIFNLLAPIYDKLIVLTVAHPNREEVKIVNFIGGYFYEKRNRGNCR